MPATSTFTKFIFLTVVVVGLYLSSLESYLLFHTMSEMFSIVVAFGIFVIGWNSRDYIKNGYLLFLAIAFLYIGFLDLLHTLSYQGMGIFMGNDYPTQLWIVTRYMESLSLVAAFCFIRQDRRLNPMLIFSGYFVLTALLVASIFWWHIVPSCYTEGVGLTPFKVISEYVICAILVLAAWLLIRRRASFDPRIHRLLLWSIAFTICSELAFTFYVHVYGFSNLIGHFFKLFAFFFIYRALIVTGIIDPHAVLFKALKDSEAKYRAMVENSMDIIWEIDDQSRYTYISPLVTVVLGYFPSEMLGKRRFDFMTKDSAAIAEQRYQELLQSGKAIHNEESTFIAKDGHRVILEANGVPILDEEGHVAGFRGMGRDVTERKYQELELRKLTRVVESSPISILLTDTAGVIEYANPAFCDMKGIDAETLTGQDVGRFITDNEETVPHPQAVAAMKNGQLWQGDLRHRNERGDATWEHVTIAPVTDRHDEVVNFAAIIEDITDRKNLDKLKEDVEQIMRHDLKGPLNGIIGLPDLIMADDNLTDKQRNFMQVIRKTGRSMLRMVNQSLDLFRMETGTYLYTPTDVDAAEVLEAVISDNLPVAKSHDVDLVMAVEAGADPRCVIKSNRDLLYPMLSNFITNALEASPEKGVVEAHLYCGPERSITIRNKGAVPKEIRGHFFEKYKTYGKKRGTGLGAYSSKLMADAMGYELQLDTSDQTDETVITIRFPE